MFEEGAAKQPQTVVQIPRFLSDSLLQLGISQRSKFGIYTE